MATAALSIAPVETAPALGERVYVALKRAITAMNIYDGEAEPRLDERHLSEMLGVSRTPLREALFRLEQEGFVRVAPRRGIFVVRKTRREIVEIITVWAALESMAARLIAERASAEEIASLRALFADVDGNKVRARIDEYSETNIRFHQALMAMSHCDLLDRTAENLLVHVRSIRKRTITEKDRAQRSIIDHMNIIEALEARDAALAERLTREHALGLAKHVEENVDYLD